MYLFVLNLASLGYVPHCDMMQFIAMASSGAYLAKAPPVSTDWQLLWKHIAVKCLNCSHNKHCDQWFCFAMHNKGI